MAKRYQRGSQKPLIEEGQTTQWPKVGRYQRGNMDHRILIDAAGITLSNLSHIDKLNQLEAEWTDAHTFTSKYSSYLYFKKSK
jgi:hypothetical protein